VFLETSRPEPDFSLQTLFNINLAQAEMKLAKLKITLANSLNLQNEVSTLPVSN